MPFVPVTDSGACAAVLDIGARDDVADVYLGGLGSASTVIFAPTVGHPALAGRRHVLVDLLGTGWSDRDDTFGHTIDEHALAVARALDALRLRAVTVIGHSLGGSVAISLAAQRRDLVGRLIVAEPNLDPGVGTFSAEIASVDEDTFAASGYDRVVGDLRLRAAEGDELAAQDARTIVRWSPRGLHRTAVSLLAARPASFREQLTALDLPKRYVTGALTGEDIDGLRATGCEVVVVPGAGHVMMHDDLDGFVATLVRP